MKMKDEKQASFDFDRPSKSTSNIQKISASKMERNFRVIRSSMERDTNAITEQDVCAINKRILDLAKQ
ncbi:hypothetical protein [Burkholderia pseudomallei]|uniref:hypothetical protein n=1 Tax=Burkholderia pseudomallei TaxID=28450 RepID=UPI0000F2873B|nr:hypothetical protein [Burkholderia pseudomallei]ABN81580.1 hypothetical protein BURPS668_0138 [Burkholderia pseudomallei 668]AUG22737.1 hypothetical protein CXQ84_20960 [Burkholderia pseudomallei]EDU09843.1 hypothetical protein BURPS1655_K1218 [Burkholderia pseudomallei 1655]UZU14926.1 hypothetical protein OSB53_18200 [Burkholderia pseudomallei]UZU22874.1 hypothetical protein OSB35_27915 [Burkholderia pseudomallei]